MYVLCQTQYILPRKLLECCKMPFSELGPFFNKISVIYFRFPMLFICFSFKDPNTFSDLQQTTSGCLDGPPM